MVICSRLQEDAGFYIESQSDLFGLQMQELYLHLAVGKGLRLEFETSSDYFI